MDKITVSGAVLLEVDSSASDLYAARRGNSSSFFFFSFFFTIPYSV